MEYEKLKDAAKMIRMTDEMKKRLIENSKAEILNLGEDFVMKTEKRNNFFRKPAVLCAVLVICLCLSVTAAAASGLLKGFFRDVVDERGAVVGTSYEQADDEISMSAAVSENILTALVSMENPQEPPYSEMEQLGITAYRIVDAGGSIAKEGSAGAVEIIGGQAVFDISLDGMDDGPYTLVVTAFTAEKKADQPLNISGCWECDFSK